LRRVFGGGAVGGKIILPSNTFARLVRPLSARVLRLDRRRLASAAPPRAAAAAAMPAAAALEALAAGPLGVVAVSTLLAAATELVQWAFIYRTPAFARVRAAAERRRAADAAAAREAPPAGGAAAAAKAAKKREARAAADRREAAGSQAAVSIKTAVVLVLSLLISFKTIGRVFGAAPVGVLPFAPPAFLRKLTQRGLAAGADARAASPLFIFMLCQASIKVLLAKGLG
jgi:hypothetical protein